MMVKMKLMKLLKMKIKMKRTMGRSGLWDFLLLHTLWQWSETHWLVVALALLPDLIIIVIVWQSWWMAMMVDGDDHHEADDHDHHRHSSQQWCRSHSLGQMSRDFPQHHPMTLFEIIRKGWKSHHHHHHKVQQSFNPPKIVRKILLSPWSSEESQYIRKLNNLTNLFSDDKEWLEKYHYDRNYQLRKWKRLRKLTPGRGILPTSSENHHLRKWKRKLTLGRGI